MRVSGLWGLFAIVLTGCNSADWTHLGAVQCADGTKDNDFNFRWNGDAADPRHSTGDGAAKASGNVCGCSFQLQFNAEPNLAYEAKVVSVDGCSNYKQLKTGASYFCTQSPPDTENFTDPDTGNTEEATYTQYRLDCGDLGTFTANESFQ